MNQWSRFMQGHKAAHKNVLALQQRLGYQFKNLSLLYTALTHRSALNQWKKDSGYSKNLEIVANERLEFLGDAVLSLVMTTELLNKWPENEGILSRARSALISEQPLAKIARNLQLGPCIFLTNNEEKMATRDKDSLLSDTLEALIGAIYCDSDFDKVSRVVLPLFTELLNAELETLVNKDAKSHLQELVQAQYKLAPSYRTVSATGPDHQRSFEVEVFIDNQVLGKGTGLSKKEASQQAAFHAIETLKDKILC